MIPSPLSNCHYTVWLTAIMKDLVRPLFQPPINVTVPRGQQQLNPMKEKTTKIMTLIKPYALIWVWIKSDYRILLGWRVPYSYILRKIHQGSLTPLLLSGKTNSSAYSRLFYILKFHFHTILYLILSQCQSDHRGCEVWLI